MPLLGQATPILRIFDEAKAKEFYVDFLDFRIGFEHRYGENFPLYMSVLRDGLELHLSEHYGDACPGAQVRIAVDDVVALSQELSAKNHRYCKPGCGGGDLTIADPFGNKLTFYTPEKVAS